jgi:hypothetical protein
MLGERAVRRAWASRRTGRFGRVGARNQAALTARFLTGSPVRDPKPRPASGDVGDHASWACVISRIGFG